jgi:nicotinamidase/pyrazinamidase
MKVRINETDALVLVDIQNDFCTGSLAVPNALDIMETVNKYIDLFYKQKLPIVFTRDWHPINHSSFKGFGGIWPDHCIQNTIGANFYKDLKIPNNSIIISKGTDPSRDAYSGFDGTNLNQKLKGLCKRLFIGGLATDYCVKATILDALSLGYTTFFLSDISKAVNINSGDEKKAIDEMLQAGAILIELDELT